MKVAIVGSRGLGVECYEYLERHVPAECAEIISGGAAGVDTLAERYAKEKGLKLTVIRPDYKIFDRAAPIVRNGQIIRQADYVLILWDGASRGTRNVIMTCMKTDKPHKLLLIQGENEANDNG